VRGKVACDKRVAVLQGIAPPVIFKEKSKTHHFGLVLNDVSLFLYNLEAFGNEENEYKIMPQFSFPNHYLL
jgi:hypothetical protein